MCYNRIIWNGRAKMKKKFYQSVYFFIFLLVAIGLILLYIVPLAPFSSQKQNDLFVSTLKQLFGAVLIVFALRYFSLSLFQTPQNPLVLLPCLLVALCNFPFISYCNGNMQFVPFTFLDIFLFFLYCLSVGVLEECIFRGLLFYLLLDFFQKNKTGFLKTYFFSSILFGVAHIFNLFAGAGIGATLLQFLYSVLTGGLFAFVLIKTKNVLCSALVHGVYNFCGTLLSESYFGTGVVFDFGSALLFAIVSVLVGVYVLRSVFSYPEQERQVLYKKFRIKTE